MTDALKICHDRILPKDMAQAHKLIALPAGAAGQPPSRGIAPSIKKLWLNGSTLRVRFLEGNDAKKEIVKKQAAWWSERTNLSFAFGNDADADIRISFDPNEGAWSYIGTDCAAIPKGQATMNLGFLDGGTAGHEFGHAIGLGHEHQNPSGGIAWNESVVLHDLAGPPNNWAPDQIRHNVLEKYKFNSFMRGTVFDPDSIMLYAFPGTWTKSGIGTKANDKPSEFDLAFGASLYPDKIRPPLKLEVNGMPVQADIGIPGEEDVFQFTAGSARRYVIETGGQTDVVMKLFGPTSPTLLIAEDDDGGAGVNSRLAVELMAGLYHVQIRHFNKTGGTGKYSISVKA